MSLDSVVLADDPRGFWNGTTGNAGQTAYDASPYGNHVYANGQGAGYGQVGVTGAATAFDFRGDLGYYGWYETGTPPVVGADFWTLEAWINPRATPAGAGIISDGYDNGADYVVAYEIGAGIDDTSTSPSAGFYDGGSWHVARQFSPYDINVWTHVVATFNNTAVRFYINGSNLSEEYTGSGFSLYSDIFFIGRRHDIYGNWIWPGLIDKPAVYDYPLTETQILNHYNAAFVAGTTYNQSVTVSVNNSVSLRRQVGKRITATPTASATQTKRVGKPVSRTVTVAPAIIKGVQARRTFTVGSTLSIFKRAGKAVTATVTSSATVAAMRVFLKALTVTVATSIGGSTTTTINDPVLYYPANEATGSTLNDVSGNGNHATLSGSPSWIAGQVSGGIRFDGTGTQYGTFASLNLGTIYTVSIWMRWQDTGDGVVIGALDGNYAFYFDATTVYHSCDAGNYSSVPHNGLGGWQHFAVVRNGINVDFYKNGTLLGHGGSLGGNTAQLFTTIARYQPGASAGAFPAQADLDEIRMYTRALSASEIADLYNFTGASAGGGLLKRVGAIRSFAVTGTPSQVKRVAATRSFTATGTPSFLKRIAKPLGFSITGAASVVTQKLASVIQKAITVTVSSTPTITKRVAKSIQATVTSTPSLTAQRLATVIQQALTVTVSASASIGKRVFKSVPFSANSVISVTRQTNKSLALAVTSAPSMIKQAGKSLVTNASVLVVKGAFTIATALRFDVSASPSIRKRINKAMTVIQSTIAFVYPKLRGTTIPTQHRVRAGMTRRVIQSGIVKRAMRSGLGDRRLR